MSKGSPSEAPPTHPVPFTAQSGKYQAVTAARVVLLGRLDIPTSECFKELAKWTVPGT